MTAGFVARVWRCFITVMVVRSGHDPPCPVHAALMTGITAPCRHHPAMDHPRPAEGRRGLVTRLASRGGRDVVRRFAHHAGISAAMTGRAASHDSRVVKRGPRKRRRGLVARLAAAAWSGSGLPVCSRPRRIRRYDRSRSRSRSRCDSSGCPAQRRRRFMARLAALASSVRASPVCPTPSCRYGRWRSPS